MKRRIRKRIGATLAAAVVGAVSIGGGVAPAAAGATDGKVTVVHAIPDLTVDIYANGGMLLEGFAPADIAGPVSLPEGSYDVEVTPSGSSDVVLSATAAVAAGADLTAVALTEAGDPTIGLFNNKMREIRKRKARVTVRHTAAAPQVDVRSKRQGGKWEVLAPEVANGEQATRGFRAKRQYKFDVVLAGTRTRVLGPATLMLERRTHYFVYAWGSAADGTLALNLSTRSLPVR